MKIYGLIIPLLLFSSWLFGGENESAELGYLDLSEYNLSKNDVDLSGEWEFYWNALLEPVDFDTITTPDYLELPLTWNGQTTVNGVPLEGIGYGTYRLRIVHNQPGEELAILVPTTGTTAKIFIDGKNVLELGHVAKTKDAAIPEFRPQTISFTAISDTTEIVLQVSNHHYKKGGAWHNFQFGLAQSIQNFHSRSVFFDFFLLGGLFIIGFYHLGLYFLRRKEVWNFYFAIGALVIIARLSASGHYIISFVDDMTWSSIMKMELGSFYAGIGALGLYLNSIFPKVFNSKILKGIVWISGLTTLFVILSPVLYSSYTVNPYQAFTILALGYYVFVILKATRNNAAGSIIFVIGFLTLIVFIVNDILLSINQIYTINLVGVGFFVFMLTQAYLLAYRVIDALYRNEKLSYKLELTNKTLEKKVQQRTQELQRSILELEKTHDELEKNITDLDEANKTKSTFFALIAHDLRGPLGGVLIGLGFMLDDLGKITEEQLKSRLQLLHRTTEKINLLVENLLQWSKTLQEKVVVNKEVLNINSEVQSVCELFQNQAESKNVILNNKTLAIEIQSDKELLQTILRNLISNAIKFTSDEGSVIISSEITEENIIVSIQDDGVGMDEGTLYDLKNKIQVSQYGTMGEKGSGIGMYLVRDYIERLEGNLTIESELEKGSTFSFTLPFKR